MVTILTTASGRPLTKRITRMGDEWSKTPIANEALFYAHEHPVSNLRDLSALLTMLEGLPQSCLIRGLLRDDAPPQPVPRRLHDGEDSRATFKPQPLPWLLCDIDGLIAPSVDMTMAQRLAFAISTLPAPFHRADCHYRWSASAGMGGWESLSLHLYFWLSSPETCAALRERAGPEGEDWAIDLAPLNPVQIHYTAAPIFDQCDDPLGAHRSGYLTRHERAVTLPPWSPPRPVYNPATRSWDRPPSKSFEDRLAAIGPDYHLPILRAAASYVATHGTDADVYDLRSRLIEAIQAAPPGKNPKRDYLSKSYLDRVIRGAVRKFGSK